MSLVTLSNMGIHTCVALFRFVWIMRIWWLFESAPASSEEVAWYRRSLRALAQVSESIRDLGAFTPAKAYPRLFFMRYEPKRLALPKLTTQDSVGAISLISDSSDDTMVGMTEVSAPVAPVLSAPDTRISVSDLMPPTEPSTATEPTVVPCWMPGAGAADAAYSLVSLKLVGAGTPSEAVASPTGGTAPVPDDLSAADTGVYYHQLIVECVAAVRRANMDGNTERLYNLYFELHRAVCVLSRLNVPWSSMPLPRRSEFPVGAPCLRSKYCTLGFRHQGRPVKCSLDFSADAPTLEAYLTSCRSCAETPVPKAGEPGSSAQHAAEPAPKRTKHLD